MRFTDHRLGLTLLALLASGCGGNLSWQTITKTAVPGTFLFRTPTEVWGSSGQSVMRRVNGSWEGVDVCKPYDQSLKYSNGKQQVSLSFEGQAVWALCGRDLEDGQTLLRHDGQGTATVIELPPDGTALLVPTQNGAPVILGETTLWTWTGTTWKSAGKNPFRGHLLSTVALAADEIYVVTDGGATLAPLWWWNGQKWQSILAGTNAHALELRFGKVWMGLSTLSGGEVTQLEFKAAKTLKDKGLVLCALLSEKTALACGGGLTTYWTIGVDDLEPIQIGSSPKQQGGSTPDVTVVDIYGNEGTVYGSYSPGKGIGRVHGIDEQTIEIVYFVEGGAFGGGGSDELIEGRR